MYELGTQDYAYFWAGKSGRWDNLWPANKVTCACQMSFDGVTE